MSDRAIVLGANILIRAVMGKRVRELIVDNTERVQFFSPDVAYADARKYLPALLEKRGVNSASAMEVLDALESIVLPLELGVYQRIQKWFCPAYLPVQSPQSHNELPRCCWLHYST
jgi:hypothetical protein